MNVPRQKFKNKQPKKKRYHSFHFEGEYEKYNAFWHHRYYFYLVDYLFKYRIYYTDFLDVIKTNRSSYVYNNLLPILFPPNKDKTKNDVSFLNIKKETAMFAVAGAFPYLFQSGVAIEMPQRRFESFDIISSRKLNPDAIKKMLSMALAFKVNDMPQSQLIHPDAIKITTKKQHGEYVYTIAPFLQSVISYFIPELYVRTLRVFSMLQLTTSPKSLSLFSNILRSMSKDVDKAYLSLRKKDDRFMMVSLERILTFYQKQASVSVDKTELYGASYIISDPHKMYVKAALPKKEVYIYADTPYDFYQLYRTFKYNGMHPPVINNLIHIKNNDYLFINE